MIMCSTWAAAVDGFAAVLQGLYRKAALSVLTSPQRWSDGRVRQARNLPISILWKVLPIKFLVATAPLTRSFPWSRRITGRIRQQAYARCSAFCAAAEAHGS